MKFLYLFYTININKIILKGLLEKWHLKTWVD
jgi:hypothetical protein